MATGHMSSTRMSRPRWPYERWTDDARAARQDIGPHMIPVLSNPVPKQSNLTSFLTNLEREIDFDSEHFEKVQRDITGMVQNALQNLQKTYKLFTGSQLLQAGSVSEGTKILSPDEFDFTVSIPQLSMIDLYTPERRHGKTENPKIVELVKDTQFGAVDAFVSNIQFALQGLMTASLVKNMASGWQMELTGCLLFERKTADTYHFIRIEDGFEVDIDICYIVPFEKQYLLDYRAFDDKKMFEIERAAADGGTIYAMLPRRYEMRFMFSHPEKKMLLSSGENRLKTYRLVKAVVKFLFPKIEQRYRCIRCNEPLLATYYFKNIILYMIAFYKDDLHWSEDQLGNRVIEVFRILDFCAKGRPIGNPIIKALIPEMKSTPCFSFYSVPTTHQILGTDVYQPATGQLVNDTFQQQGKLAFHMTTFNKQKVIEESAFFGINETLFQIHSKAKLPILRHEEVLNHIHFREPHDYKDIKFDSSKSTPGRLRIDDSSDKKVLTESAMINKGLSEKRCFLPDQDKVMSLFPKEVATEVTRYFKFLKETKWNEIDVILSISELLLCLRK